MRLSTYGDASIAASPGVGLRLPQLDALRGVAITLVFLYHLYPNRVPGGYIGVDVFFVLSGYLAALAIRKDSFLIGAYLQKRVERILPPLLVMVAACMAAGFILLFSSEYMQLSRHAARSLLFVQNLQLKSELDYFDKALQLKPLANLWSLAVEMQFYILAVPLLHLSVQKLGIRLTQVFAWLAVIAALLTAMLLPDASYYDAVPRLIPFLGGALLGLRGFQLRGLAMPHWMHVMGLALCSAGLLALAFLMAGNIRYPGWLILLPTILTLGMVRMSPPLATFIACRFAPLVFLGVISYSLYLWHWPIMSLAKIQMSGDAFSTSLKLQITLGSLLAAWWSHRFVERAVWSRRLRQPVYAMGLVFAAALLATAAWSLSAHPVTYARLAQREGADTSSQVEGLYQWRIKDKACLAMVRFDPPQCRFHDRGYRPSIALLGDSHAGALFDGLDQAFRSQKQGVIHFGAPGCPPFYNLNRQPSLYKPWDKCSSAINPALDHVLHAPDLRIVILSAYFDWSRKDEPSAEPDLIHEGQEKLEGSEAWRASMRQTLSALQRAGKKVVFLLDVPRLGFDPKSCQTLRPVLGDAQRQRACYQSRQDIQAQFVSSRQRPILDTLREFPDILVVNGADAICDTSLCYGMKDGSLLYSDTNHLSVAGSLLVGRLIAERMRTAQFVAN